MKLIRRAGGGNRVLITAQTATLAFGGGNVQTAGVNISAYDDVVIEIENTSVTGGPVAGDTVQPMVEFNELANALAGWVPQMGYRIYEIDSGGVTANGDRTLKYVANRTGADLVPRREALLYTGSLIRARVNFTNNMVVTNPSTMVFNVRYYGRARPA